MPRGGPRPGSGRKPGSQNRDTAERRAALADLAADHVETALATLASIAADGASESARVSAAIAILDRTYGRPGQAIDHHHDAPDRPTRIELCAAEPALDLTNAPDAVLEWIVQAGDRQRGTN
jgi:hypothetical protein